MRSASLGGLPLPADTPHRALLPSLQQARPSTQRHCLSMANTDADTLYGQMPLAQDNSIPRRACRRANDDEVHRCNGGIAAGVVRSPRISRMKARRCAQRCAWPSPSLAQPPLPRRLLARCLGTSDTSTMRLTPGRAGVASTALWRRASTPSARLRSRSRFEEKASRVASSARSMSSSSCDAARDCRNPLETPAAGLSARCTSMHRRKVAAGQQHLDRGADRANYPAQCGCALGV